MMPKRVALVGLLAALTIGPSHAEPWWRAGPPGGGWHGVGWYGGGWYGVGSYDGGGYGGGWYGSGWHALPHAYPRQYPSGFRPAPSYPAFYAGSPYAYYGSWQGCCW